MICAVKMMGTSLRRTCWVEGLLDLRLHRALQGVMAGAAALVRMFADALVYKECSLHYVRTH